MPAVALDQCLALFQQNVKDEQNFFALLMLSKLPFNYDSTALALMYEKVNFDFLGRLLETPAGTEEDVLRRSIAVNVLSAFVKAGMLDVCDGDGAKLTERIPALSKLLLSDVPDIRSETLNMFSLFAATKLGMFELFKKNVFARIIDCQISFGVEESDGAETVLLHLWKKANSAAIESVRLLQCENATTLLLRFSHELLTNPSESKFRLVDFLPKFWTMLDADLRTFNPDAPDSLIFHFGDYPCFAKTILPGTPKFFQENGIDRVLKAKECLTWSQDLRTVLHTILTSKIDQFRREAAFHLTMLLVEKLGADWLFSVRKYSFPDTPSSTFTSTSTLPSSSSSKSSSKSSSSSLSTKPSILSPAEARKFPYILVQLCSIEIRLSLDHLIEKRQKSRHELSEEEHSTEFVKCKVVTDGRSYDRSRIYKLLHACFEILESVMIFFGQLVPEDDDDEGEDESDLWKSIDVDQLLKSRDALVTTGRCVMEYMDFVQEKDFDASANVMASLACLRYLSQLIVEDESFCREAKPMIPRFQSFLSSGSNDIQFLEAALTALQFD